MRIRNIQLLKTIFGLKGNFAKGKIPGKRVFQGAEVSALKNDAKAAVCISADFELNWAWRELSERERDIRGSRERENLPRILRLLEEYSIPITWATVGHLFLRSCERRPGEIAHTGMPRPPVNERWEGDWYVHDPCTDLPRDPLWYAPDLIEQIKKSPSPHEIGSHSFSHIDFLEKRSNATLIRKEIEECSSAMKPFGLKPRSLVFPFNKMGYSYLDVLAGCGIIAVRHRDKAVRLSYPERTDRGVYKIYESMNLRKPRYYDYLDKAKIFIEQAIERNAVYHLWFHPSDPIQLFENEFRRIIEHIACERERGTIWVATMAELASYCEAREKTCLRVQRDEKAVTIFLENSLDREKYGTPEITLVVPVDRTPEKISLQLADHEVVISPGNPSARRDKHKLVVNVPVSARSLRLVS